MRIKIEREVMLSPQEIKESTKQAMQEIARGASEFIGQEYIASLVERFYTTGERFIVKAGFDPTAPDFAFGTHGAAIKACDFSTLWG